MVVAMVTKVIQVGDIGRAVQMYSKHLNALPQIHFADGRQLKNANFSDNIYNSSQIYRIIIYLHIKYY